MSGDWIKMRGNLWDDPRVGRICDLTGCKEATAIGALYWLWATADQHTEDGCMPGLSLQQIDRKTGVKGFAAALVDVGWLVDDAAGVRIERFEEHNGKSAKKRLETARRVAKHRAGIEEVTPDQEIGNAESVTGALAREREREREEETRPSKHQQLAASAQAPTPPPPFRGDANAEELNGRHVVALDAAWELPEAWGVDAEALGWQPKDVLRESEKFRQYWTAGKGAATRRSVKGWRQSWSNWLAKAERFAR